jgi:co-chaperonin GroES (HSP10)
MFRTLGDNVIIKPDSDSWKTKHPRWDENNNPISYELESGTVMAVGPGSWYQGSYEPVGVEVGQRVLFEAGRGDPVTYHGEVYLQFNGYDIVGIEE